MKARLFVRVTCILCISTLVSGLMLVALAASASAQGRQQSTGSPDFCQNQYNSEELQCFASNPPFCQSAMYATRRACFLTTPPYCASDSNADTVACFTAHPGFCSSETHANRGACFAAGPRYCASETYSNTWACFASRPTYCSNTTYSDRLACSGANPPFCRQASAFPNLSLTNSRACSGAGRPTRSETLEVARRLDVPLNVSQLVQQLTRGAFERRPGDGRQRTGG